MYEDIIKKHPDKKAIFELTELLTADNIPYYFNFEQDLRPTPFNQDGEDPESIDWNTYQFILDIEADIIAKKPYIINVSLNNEVLDLALINVKDNKEIGGNKGVSAEQAAEIIKTSLK